MNIHDCATILGQILEKFDFGNFEIYQSYDKPPWRIFDFFVKFLILAKIEFLKSLTLAKIEI